MLRDRIYEYQDLRQTLSKVDAQAMCIVNAAQCLNPPSDTTSFAEHLMIDPTLKRRNYKQLNFDLPESLEKINELAGRLELKSQLKESKPTGQRKSLLDIVRKQGSENKEETPKSYSKSAMHPVVPRFPPPMDNDLSFKIPKIFSAVKRAVEDMGGYHTEGIFRVNGDIREIQDMMTHIFEEEDCEIRPSTVHCAAGLVKKYLRDFYEPIFKCSPSLIVEIAGQFESEDPEVNELAKSRLLKEVFEVIPERTKMIVIGLMIMFREITSKDNSPKTKMTVTSIATIFAPIFIVTDAVDAMGIIAQSRCAAFVLKS